MGTAIATEVAPKRTSKSLYGIDTSPFGTFVFEEIGVVTGCVVTLTKPRVLDPALIPLPLYPYPYPYPYPLPLPLRYPYRCVVVTALCALQGVAAGDAVAIGMLPRLGAHSVEST